MPTCRSVSLTRRARGGHARRLSMCAPTSCPRLLSFYAMVVLGKALRVARSVCLALPCAVCVCVCVCVCVDAALRRWAGSRRGVPSQAVRAPYASGQVQRAVKGRARQPDPCRQVGVCVHGVVGRARVRGVMRGRKQDQRPTSREAPGFSLNRAPHDLSPRRSQAGLIS